MLSSNTIHNLNRDCFCFPLDRESIDNGFAASVPDAAQHCQSRPNLFARTGVLLDEADLASMTAVIEAIETVIRNQHYLAEKVAREPSLQAWQRVSGHGLIMSYDFHIGESGPKLIEVNTNAGGGFLVNELHSVSQSLYPPCCGFGPLGLNREKLYELLQLESNSAGRKGGPAKAVIVDENPQEQYLYPDMEIARDYFERSGVQTRIADIKDLVFTEGVLRYRGEVVDMVYNRSTDFTLQKRHSKALREAALSNAAVVSPNRYHHTLYADKRNFIDWTDKEKLLRYGLSDELCDLLKRHLPETCILDEENADSLYANRKQMFFKPVDGYGSKAVYRGDKITARVWQQIEDAVKSGQRYIAQKRVPPTLRAVDNANGNRRLKYDIRLYTYSGTPMIAAARIYQGQTTNFRTDGGGLAPVYKWSDAKASATGVCAAIGAAG